MIIETGISRLNLRSGDVLRLRGTAGATIACDRGTIWVTQDNHREDLVLGPGDRIDLAQPQAVVVQAFESSSIAIGPIGADLASVDDDPPWSIASALAGRAAARVAIDLRGSPAGARLPAWLRAA